MKLKYKTIVRKMAWGLLALPLLVSSCDYLDVAPPKRQTLTDAMKDKQAVLNWLTSCYWSVGACEPIEISRYEASAEAYVMPRLWNQSSQLVSWNQISPSWNGGTEAGDRLELRWRTCYGGIGNVHLFLDQLAVQHPENVTEEDKVRYRAEMKFLNAYYHFLLLELYGPIPTMNAYGDPNMPKDEFPGRSHFDYVVDYICQQLDEAAQDLPATYTLDETWGRANKVICKAVKARLLLYAASPLWNGSFPYSNWKNTNYETPGYGNELVSHTYDPQKWQRALQACQEALDVAINEGGRSLLDMNTAMALAAKQNVPLPYIPGLNTNTEEGKEFQRRVLLMSYVCTADETDGNHEFIFGSTDRITPSYMMPLRMFRQSNGQWIGGYNRCNPTLYAVENFYTKNGKPVRMDPNFTREEDWLKSANVPGRAEIINLNVSREPRFYAWITFDGADYGSLVQNGSPLRINFRSSDAQGYNPQFANRDLNQTGYLMKKFVSPDLKFTDGGNNMNDWTPTPIIRLAELYLNLAECQAETGDVDGALASVNVIRERAGVPALTRADLTDGMTIVDWVRQERFVELYCEGHRYYDLRRWMIAPEKLGAKREGLNAFEGNIYNPTFEQFNQRVTIQQPFQWQNRMYLIPIHQSEVYSNPQLVQSPEY